MSTDTQVYADSGINWEFLYEILYEDDEILVLKDLGRYHKYDQDRMWTKPIKAYIRVERDGFAYHSSFPGEYKRKLVEVQS